MLFQPLSPIKDEKVTNDKAVKDAEIKIDNFDLGSET